MIGIEQWEDLELAEAPPGETDGSFSKRKDQRFGAPLTGYWRRVRIDRETLLEAFPVDAKPDNKNWRVRPGERPATWLRRPEVGAEAERRLNSGETRNKKSINGVLKLMAEECGVVWSQRTIQRLRQGG